MLTSSSPCPRLCNTWLQQGGCTSASCPHPHGIFAAGVRLESTTERQKVLLCTKWLCGDTEACFVNRCAFSHGFGDLKWFNGAGSLTSPKANLTLCPFWLRNGTCSSTQCKFAHGTDQLGGGGLGVAPYRMCAFWYHGRCSTPADTCHFEHKMMTLKSRGTQQRAASPPTSVPAMHNIINNNNINNNNINNNTTDPWAALWANPTTEPSRPIVVAPVAVAAPRTSRAAPRTSCAASPPRGRQAPASHTTATFPTLHVVAAPITTTTTTAAAATPRRPSPTRPVSAAVLNYSDDVVTLYKTGICHLSKMIKELATHFDDLPRVRELAATLTISPNPLRSEMEDEALRVGKVAEALLCGLCQQLGVTVSGPPVLYTYSTSLTPRLNKVSQKRFQYRLGCIRTTRNMGAHAGTVVEPLELYDALEGLRDLMMMALERDIHFSKHDLYNS